jgi:hypothetical protein
MANHLKPGPEGIIRTATTRLLGVTPITLMRRSPRRPDQQSVKAVMLLDGRVNVVKVAMGLPFTPVSPVPELRCWQLSTSMEIT